MISRKKIILKSEDLGPGKCALKSGGANKGGYSEEEFFNEASAGDYSDENTWFSLEQLISDQISEIINKWSAIDDEIWGKVVCFERNRRIAKVYARSQVLSVSGSECDFDGSRIGLNAFPNGRRDEETAAVKRQIKSGFKIKIDDLGNLYIKRVGKCAVYIATGEDCLQPSFSSSAPSSTKPGNNSSNCSQLPTTFHSSSSKPVHFRSLEANTALTIFDMRSFLGAIADWSARHPAVRYPPADFLERFHQKCIHLIQVVVKEDGSPGLNPGGNSSSSQRLLRHPCWIVLVNIVGLDLLWSRFGYSSMILLNQTQLVSLRSCFALGGPTRPSEPSQHYKSRGARGEHFLGQHSAGKNSRRHADSDDLYYSGYKAKISAHSAQGALCPGGSNGNKLPANKLPSTKLPISPSSSLLLSRFAANRSDLLFSNGNNNCAYQPNLRARGQFYYNDCHFPGGRGGSGGDWNGGSRNLQNLSCRSNSQIPRFIIGSKREFIRTAGGDCRGPNSLSPHHRRLARSSTHLHCFTSSTSNSSAEDNCGGLTSSSSAEELSQAAVYHPSSKYINNSNSNCTSTSSSGSGAQWSSSSNNLCDSNASGGHGSKKKFKSGNKGGVSSQHQRRIYTRNSNGGGNGKEGKECRKLQLLNMRKLSSSNLELSSGTFYDLEEESGKGKRTADKSGGILKNGKSNSD